MLKNYKRMLQLQGKNIAFVFSDPAGANACMALEKMLQIDDGLKLLYSNRNYDGIQNLILCTEAPSLDGIDTIFLGTSHPESSNFFELECLKRAKRKGIYTISFIDHWVNFKLRFTDRNDETIFPDEIWVMDEVARKMAIVEGLPAKLIKVTGNPFHLYLSKHWKSRWYKKAYLRTLGIRDKGFHILFAPDPLSLRNNAETIGFSEAEGLENILKIIEELNNSDLHLVLKCHPLQPVETLNRVLEKSKYENVTLVQNADTLELIYAADLVIGFYSNILLDAAALGKEVIRYFPGKDEADLLKHNTDLIKIKETTEVYNQLKKFIYG